MTMKSLLLGAAAGLVTVGAAQAADLPMTKAEAVEYVKVCTEFGEGFFYIPGTDTCLKIAGEVRADYQFDSRDGRGDDVTAFDSEARLKFDARTATEWGTLRSYIQMNFNYEAGTTSSKVDKAYIQFGGLTAGKAHSFFGLYDNDYANTIFSGYFGAGSDANLLAYTATFGGGFSATISIEDGLDHRADEDSDVSGSQGLARVAGATAILANYGGQSLPDLVANLRLDQSWGKAMLSGAVHQIRYPIDVDADYGFAVAASVAFDLPIAAGGWVAVEGTYADGATRYLGVSNVEYAFNAAGETDGRAGWSATGEIGVNVSPDLTLVAFASYLALDGFSIGAFDIDDTDAWVVGANATYTVVPGLTVGAEISYQDNVNISDSTTNNFDDGEDEWAGGVRIKRTF